MRTDARWLVTFAGNAVFLWLIRQLNHHLTDIPLWFGSTSVHLWLLGLPIAFLGLRLSLPYAIAAGGLTALFVEASLPVPTGLIIISSLALICLTVSVRSSFNRLDPASSLLTALIVNLTYFLVLSVALPPPLGATGGLRLGLDLVASQALLVPLYAWFFAWQLALLRLFGIDLETELRETP